MTVRRQSRARPEKLADFFDAAYDVAADDQAWIRAVMEGAIAVFRRPAVAHGAVAYLAIGQSTKETAYALGISDVTVRVLLARAAAKLGVRSRAELLAHDEVPPLRPGGKKPRPPIPIGLNGGRLQSWQLGRRTGSTRLPSICVSRNTATSGTNTWTARSTRWPVVPPSMEPTRQTSSRSWPARFMIGLAACRRRTCASASRRVDSTPIRTSAWSAAERSETTTIPTPSSIRCSSSK